MRTHAAFYITLLVYHAVPSTAVVTIADESGKSIMRRQKAVEAQSDGTFHLSALAEGEGHLTTDPVLDITKTCNDDFPLGNNNSNTCANSTYHRTIWDSNICKVAQEVAEAGYEEDFFFLDKLYSPFHPQGCFAHHCGQTQNRTGSNYSICYYYNPDSVPPRDPQGSPVCFRADYLNGTNDTNGGCDPGYQNVMDETTCREAAHCLGFAVESEFRIGEWNFSKHNEYPKGCFIRKDTEKFQYNNISSLLGSDPAHPEIGGGIPVCNVSSVVHWG